MIANGHADADLWGYSWEKIMLLYQFAIKRTAKESVTRMLWELRSTRLAVMACFEASDLREFNSVSSDLANRLEEIVQPKSPKEKAAQAMDAMAEALRMKGVKNV